MGKRKKGSNLLYWVYVSEGEKNGVKYISAYVKRGNFEINLVYPIGLDTDELGAVQLGWKIASSLSRRADSSDVVIVSDNIAFKDKGVITLDDIYEDFYNQLYYCVITPSDLKIQICFEENNNATQLIKNYNNGMTFSRKTYQ